MIVKGISDMFTEGIKIYIKVFFLKLITVLELEFHIKLCLKNFQCKVVKLHTNDIFAFVSYLPKSLSTEINTNIRFSHYSIAVRPLLYVVLKECFCISGIIPLQFVKSIDIGVCITSDYK